MYTLDQRVFSTHKFFSFSVIFNNIEFAYFSHSDAIKIYRV